MTNTSIHMLRPLLTQSALKSARLNVILSSKRAISQLFLQNATVPPHRRNSMPFNSIKRQRIDCIVGPHYTHVINAVRYNAITASTDGSNIPNDVKNLTNEEYHRHADATFEQITEELDIFFEENGIMEAEVDEEAGVMEINCSEGTYVINKQPPTKQIWLSSPISGPKRFDFHDGKWICLRDNAILSQLLADEMSSMYQPFQWSQSF